MLFSSTKRYCATNRLDYLWSKVLFQSDLIFFLKWVFALLLTCSLSTVWGGQGADSADERQAKKEAVRSQGSATGIDHKQAVEAAVISQDGITDLGVAEAAGARVIKKTVTTYSHTAETRTTLRKPKMADYVKGESGETSGLAKETNLQVPVLTHDVSSDRRPPDTSGSLAKKDAQSRKSEAAIPDTIETVQPKEKGSTTKGDQSVAAKTEQKQHGTLSKKSKSGKKDKKDKKDKKHKKDKKDKMVKRRLNNPSSWFLSKNTESKREKYVEDVSDRKLKAYNEQLTKERAELKERLAKLEQQVGKDDTYKANIIAEVAKSAEAQQQAVLASISGAGANETARLQGIIGKEVEEAAKNVNALDKSALTTFKESLAQAMDNANQQSAKVYEDVLAGLTASRMKEHWDEIARLERAWGEKSAALQSIIQLREKAGDLKGLSRENKIGSFKNLPFSGKPISYDRNDEYLKRGFGFPAFGVPEGWGVITADKDDYRFIAPGSADGEDAKLHLDGVEVRCEAKEDDDAPLRMCYMAKMHTEDYSNDSYLMARVSYSLTQNQAVQEDNTEAEQKAVSIKFYTDSMELFKEEIVESKVSFDAGKCPKIDKWIQLERPRELGEFYVGLDINIASGSSIIIHDVGAYEWSVEPESHAQAKLAFHFVDETFDKRLDQFVRSYPKCRVTEDAGSLRKVIVLNGSNENRFCTDLNLWGGVLGDSQNLVWSFEYDVNNWLNMDGDDVKVSTFKKEGENVNLIFYRKDML